MHAPKITGVRLGVAALGAAFVVLIVPAQSRAAAEEAPAKKETTEKKMPSYPELMKMKPADVEKMMDKDKDGYVTHEEFMNFYESLFKRLDRDHNQRLSAVEFTDKG